LEQAAALQPAAILLDFEMPKLSGPDLCRALKGDPRTCSIPVLFLTSHTGEQEIGEAFAAGADDYIVKPPRERELVSRLTRIVQNLELQARVKAQFEEQAHLIRIVSHHINNLLALTMAGIDGMARVVRKGVAPDDPGFERELKRAAGGAERIRDLVSNVQELQALDDTKRQVELSAVRIKPLLDDCQEVFAAKLAAKELRLEISCPDDVAVLADPVSLSNSVINNLVSNAIKFSFRGGVVEIVARRSADAVEVIVRDHGLGMSADLLGKIFSRSEKTSRAGTDKEKGTGFGMPIVKRYVELFGGSITAESVPREQSDHSGTTFRLRFQAAN
jgi:signal transduction histidine kinase